MEVGNGEHNKCYLETTLIPVEISIADIEKMYA